MPTKLQEAPAIGTIEITEDEEFQVPDEMIAHLYVSGIPNTLCGMSRDLDPHDSMHRRYGDYIARAKKGDKACPVCGAKLCERCEQRMLEKLSR